MFSQSRAKENTRAAFEGMDLLLLPGFVFARSMVNAFPKNSGLEVAEETEKKTLSLCFLSQ